MVKDLLSDVLVITIAGTTVVKVNKIAGYVAFCAWLSERL